MSNRYLSKQLATALYVSFAVSIAGSPIVNAETAGLSSRDDVKALNAEAMAAAKENVGSHDESLELNAEAARSTQVEVDSEVNKLRESIISDAVEAVVETNKALMALEKDQPEEAVAAIKTAIGKLAITLEREPDLGLKPIHVMKTMHDLRADPAIIKEKIETAEKHLKDGELQDARMLISPLVSDITISTTSMPLNKYPEALKAVVPLIDEGKTLEAKNALQALLSTLVTKDLVIPLPPLRAKALLAEAETLVENEKRTEEENEKLQTLLTQAHDELKMSELLGYGDKEAFKPMHELIDEVEEKMADGKAGKGWFDAIKQRWSKLFAAN